MESYTNLFPSSSMASSRVADNDFLGEVFYQIPSFKTDDDNVREQKQGVFEQSEGKSCTSKEEGNKTKKKQSRNPRFAFQTRSPVDVLDDGYRWRKYGQKDVKNNKFPRSYYRCTQQGCNVKKQVQRLSTDEAIVVTTYDGVHTHHIEKPNDNFEHILSQMQIYTPT